MPRRFAEVELSRKRAVCWLVLLISGCVLIPAQDAAPANTPLPEKSPLRKALERSLLFPGLGQLGEKQYVKAVLFGGGEIFCLAQVLIFMGKGNNAYKKYLDATDYLEVMEFRGLTERYDRRRNTAILAAAGVWVLNMIDILIFAKKKYGRKTAIVFQPYYNHENKTIGTGMCFHF